MQKLQKKKQLLAKIGLALPHSACSFGIMKIITAFILLTTSFTASIAQSKVEKLNPWGGRNGVQFSIGFLNGFESSITYVISDFPIKHPEMGMLAGFQSINVGVGYTVAQNQLYTGPKIAYQKTWAIFSGQAAFDYQTSLRDDYFRFSPKLGISFFGFYSIIAGYNIIVSDRERKMSNAPFTITAQMTFLK